MSLTGRRLARGSESSLGTHKHHCRALERLDLEPKAPRKCPRVSAQEVASIHQLLTELYLLKLASSSRRQAPRCQETVISLEEVHTNYTLKRKRGEKKKQNKKPQKTNPPPKQQQRKTKTKQNSLKHRCCSLRDFSSGSFLLKCWIHDQKRADIYF